MGSKRSPELPDPRRLLGSSQEPWRLFARLLALEVARELPRAMEVTPVRIIKKVVN